MHGTLWQYCKRVLPRANTLPCRLQELNGIEKVLVVVVSSLYKTLKLDIIVDQTMCIVWEEDNNKLVFVGLWCLGHMVLYTCKHMTTWLKIL